MRQPNMLTMKSARALAMGGAALLAATALPATASAGDAVYSIDLNKTQVLRLPAAAGAIVVGNPGIADVTVHSPQTLFVVGRGFGETNLIILDRAGQMMMDADIQVTAVTPDHGVRVFTGGLRRTYSCAPYCQPSPVLGDDPEFVGQNQVTVEASTAAGTSVFEEAAGLMDSAGSEPQPFPTEAMMEAPF